ncbi:MFS transporter [Streptomyces malaysiensis]|uniref:MFS transporter n=1 Tax=Streptomyces malaysiensis TaxID=92644 RepID=UPI003717CC44
MAAAFRRRRHRTTTDRRAPDLAVLITLMTGTLLAPLNSSMVAVALVPVRQHFATTLPSVTWMVTAFYLAACVAQPIMGRIADVFGPRRVFISGMALAALASGAAPFAPTVGALVACRAVQAIGGAAAFPCAMVLLARRGRATGHALTGIAAANTVSGAVGPVLGGALVALGGWGAIFWINLPLTVGALVAALLLFEPPPRPERLRGRRLLRGLDPLGIALFTAAAVGLLEVMLNVSSGAFLPGLLLFVAATALFTIWETRTSTPFIDLSALAGAGGLSAVYLLFVLFNLAYYGAFYGLPQWFQDGRHFTSGQAGLLILPIAATGALATVLAPALLRRLRPPYVLLAGALMLMAGLAGVAAFGAGTPVWLLVADGVLLGLPYGLCNLGLQRLMYERAPAPFAGVAGGLFQSCRYLGAILAVGLVGSLPPQTSGGRSGLTGLGLAMTVVATAFFLAMAADFARRRDSRRRDSRHRGEKIPWNPGARANQGSMTSEADRG